MEKKYNSIAQDKVLIKNCLKEIENRLGWIDSVKWQQKQFEKLSETIFEKTNVNLSPVTLKRLWGKVNYSSQPSTSTLDALACFIGYEDWMDFTNRSQTKKTFTLKKTLSRYKKVVLTSGVLAAIFILAAITTFRSVNVPAKDYADHKFSVYKLSSGLPNTAHFKYDARNTDADSVMIQQSWDVRLRRVVDKGKTDFSCLYYYPGYYKAKLVLDDSIVAEQDLMIESEGLKGIIHKDPVPFYLNPTQIKNENGLGITEAHLEEAGIDLKNDVPTCTINLVGGLEDIQGDNFSIEADIRHNFPKGNAICQRCGITILCTNGNFRIPLSIKGCVSDLKVVIPGKRISAKDTDLSSLGTDFSDFVNLKVTVKKEAFEVCVGDNPPYRNTLTVDPGKVVGFKFNFLGPGEVKSFQVKSNEKCYTMADFLP